MELIISTSRGRTGDEVEIDENGTVYVVDRIKSIIKCNVSTAFAFRKNVFYGIVWLNWFFFG